MRINTNVAALNSQESAANTQKLLGASLEKLSSGLRINKASDDASGLAIADKLRTQASSISQSISNGNSAVSLTQIADKAMAEQSNILDIVKQKLVQASTATTSAEGRTAIGKDINKLLTQLDNIATQTNYNGIQLLQESAGGTTSSVKQVFQMGEKSTNTIDLASGITANTSGLSIDVLKASAAGGFSAATDAQGYLTTVDSALNTLNAWRADVGSTQNQLESGVRNLEKQIAKLIRSKAKNIVSKEKSVNISDKNYLTNSLGPKKYFKDSYENNLVAGVVTGLAWTSVGGEILFIESSISPGKGDLTITGNLGKIMKESAIIAMEYIKSNAKDLGIHDIDFSKFNIHIHVPEGATPKDGPSAGITMLTSLVSLFTQKRVKKNIAMTGEITLRGKVLPVGGIKEKILAAKRANIKEIILSIENKKDIEEIKKVYLRGIKFIFVKNMFEVIDYSITNRKVPNSKFFKL